MTERVRTPEGTGLPGRDPGAQSPEPRPEAPGGDQNPRFNKASCGAGNVPDPPDGATPPGSRKLKGESEEEFEDRLELQARLGRIRHRVVVLSGKGGVGKSTVAVNLAVALALSGERVGLLDVDIHGPSIPTMLGLEGETVQRCEDGILPVDLGGMKVMSLGFMLKSQDDAVIWRGPMKAGIIKQFLKNVAWGDLDFLVVDAPPGTGDEPLSLCQLIGRMDGAVVVTTPQKVAAVDVRKCISFCRKLDLPVLGVVENMSGFSCPACGAVTRVFRSGGGSRLAQDMNVPFLGAIPLDPQIADCCDEGHAYLTRHADSVAARTMREIVEAIGGLGESGPSTPGR